MTPEEYERFEARRNGLKESIDSLGKLLIFFIVIVVIGLIVELTRPIASLVNGFDPWVLAELIGTVGVAIGVAGELAVEWNAHRKERELLSIDAEIENDAKRVIAELNLQIEQERHARVKLEQRFADRDITEEQADAIRDKLKDFAGQEFALIAYWENPESEKFAGLLLALLRDYIGWVLIRRPWGQMPAGRIGVHVFVHPDADATTKSAAAALVSALSDEGLSATPQLFAPSPKSNVISLNVGLNF
jgi:hypothetical protein